MTGPITIVAVDRAPIRGRQWDEAFAKKSLDAYLSGDSLTTKQWADELRRKADRPAD